MADRAHLIARMPVAPAVHLALLLVQVLFASLGVAGKLALRELPPFALVAVRVTSAALLLLAVRAFYPWERVERRHLGWLALYALLGVVANQLLFFSGLSRTTATNAVVLGTTIPIFTVGAALLLGRERATPRRLAGLGLAFAGALVVAGGGKLSGGRQHFVGNLLILANSLSFALYLVISRDLLTRYRAITVVAWTFAFATLGVLPAGAGAFETAAPQVTWRGWALIAYIVLFPTMGTYFLNVWALARAPASLVAIYIYAQPALGALLAWALLGERLTTTTAIGALPIALGIWLAAVSARPRRSGAPPP
jgi:drug/metabolite transporter (DMT)-like permease